ncbi:hypothetical protein H4R24_004792 [Coemansia sp. RSA 988]|nr:hypothetical protein H4R24_004792 [Coemansia sp. RSA 988]
MLRILESFSRLALRSNTSQAVVFAPTRAFAATAGNFNPAAAATRAKKAAPTRKTKPAASKPKKKTTTAATKKPKAVKPKKVKKGPTKKEQLEAKLTTNRALIKPPKAAPSPYAIFIQKFEGFSPGSEPSNIAERARVYSAKWKSLSDSQKHAYQEESQKLRVEREKELRKWWATVDLDLVALENRRRRRLTLPACKPLLLKDPFKPKRPAAAFIRFASERVKDNKDSSDGNASVTVAIKDAAQHWKNMSESEKAPFMKAAQADAHRYREDMEKYLKSRLA